MLVQQIWGGTVHWTQLPVYLAAEILAGAAAALAFTAISRTAADAQVPNIDEKTFQDVANKTKTGCPVSQALSATPIELTAKLMK